MTVLVTGSNGTIGSLVCENLGEQARPFDLPEYDARNFNQLCEQMLGCVATMHLAWNTATDNISFSRPTETTDPENYAMAQNVLRAAREVGTKRVLVASSIHADLPAQEPDGIRSPYRLPEPDSPYGATKVGIEALARYYARLGLETVCIRFGWVDPDPTVQPGQTDRLYPPGEGWLSHGDLRSLVARCIEAPVIPDNYQLLYGLSHRVDGVHDLSNALGWSPQSTYSA